MAVWQAAPVSSRPTRRAVLTGSAAAAALTACTRTSRRRAAAPAAVDPDVELRAAAVAREQSLLDAYDAAATNPGLQARLAPLRAEHAAHLQALGALPVPGIPPPSTPTLSQLIALERRAAAAHTAAAVPASRRLAPVLASLAASETTHVGVL